MSKPKISLVVLGFRNFEKTTAACLNSLLPWVEDPEIEILALDNGSPDDSPRRTEQWCQEHPQVKCLLSSENRGYAGGMNWGATHASGDWLLLVNNDTVFPAHALDALKRVTQSVPEDVGMLAPITNAAGNGQRLWSPQASHQTWLEIGGWLNQNPTERLFPVYRCDFFCIAIRSDVWIKLGGLDTEFGLGYYEDFDFSLRLSAAGYQQAITEDVFILHLGSASFQGSQAARELIKKNKKLLIQKHSQAKFLHTRQGNLAILNEYLKLRQRGEWSHSLERRLQLRLGALEGDAPRSWVKRWLWKRKCLPILKAFGKNATS